MRLTGSSTAVVVSERIEVLVRLSPSEVAELFESDESRVSACTLPRLSRAPPALVALVADADKARFALAVAAAANL